MDDSMLEELSQMLIGIEREREREREPLIVQ
jgi:hypothetical protein